MEPLFMAADEAVTISWKPEISHNFLTDVKMIT